MKMRGLILASALISGCATTPAPLPIGPLAITAGPTFSANYYIVNDAGSRRTPSANHFDFAELYSPRFSEVIVDSFGAFLDARLTKQGEPRIRVTVQEASVLPDRDGLDVALPITQPFRKSTVIVSARVVFELEEAGRVTRTYTLNHSTRFEAGHLTEQARARSTADAIAQWRREALDKVEQDFLHRYL